MILERTFSSTIILTAVGTQQRSYKSTVHSHHTISKRHVAWRHSWDHTQVQYMALVTYPNIMMPWDSAKIIHRYSTHPSRHIPTSCCLETELRSYTGTVHDPHTISQRHAAWRLSWNHIQVQCTSLTPYPTSCCLETQLRSYIGGHSTPYMIEAFLKVHMYTTFSLICKTILLCYLNLLD